MRMATLEDVFLKLTGQGVARLAESAMFKISRRFIRVWQRDFTVYRKSWKISFVPPLLEPLFYLTAFAVGLSGLVGNLRFRGMKFLTSGSLLQLS